MLPDSKTLSTLLDRYGNIIIDSFEEGSSVEESVSVDGISEECTAYEGIISEKSAYTIVEKVLTTAKDDEEIKALFDQWSDDASNEENQYKDFQNLITDALDDMNRDDEGFTENEAFSSKVWVNGDGKIVGRQFGITDGTDTTPVFTWKAPSEGEDSALLLELAADDSSFTFTGSGKTADGLLNGDYILAVNGTNLQKQDIITEPLIFPSLQQKQTAAIQKQEKAQKMIQIPRQQICWLDLVQLLNLHLMRMQIRLHWI